MECSEKCMASSCIFIRLYASSPSRRRAAESHMDTSLLQEFWIMMLQYDHTAAD